VFKKKCCKKIYSQGRLIRKKCLNNKRICPILRSVSYFTRYNKNGCSRRRKCVTRSIRGKKLSRKCKWSSSSKCPLCVTQKCYRRKNRRGSKCCTSKWRNGARVGFRCFNSHKHLRTRKTCNFIVKKGCTIRRQCIKHKRHFKCKKYKRCSNSKRVYFIWKQGKKCFVLKKCFKIRKGKKK